MKSAKKTSTTANKRAKNNSTEMETSSRMGKTTRAKTTRSKTSRAKNCGRQFSKKD